MEHEHDFTLDLDGQITCCICGCRDDEMFAIPQWKDPYEGLTNQEDFE